MSDDFARVFDASPVPTWVFDRETLAFVAVNRAACELYGYTREEFLALSLRDIRPPDDIPRLEHAIARHRQDVAPFSRFGRHRTKDGREIDVQVDIGRAIFGGRECSMAVITNITGMREHERQLRLLVENSNDGITINNPDGGIAYMSPGGERVLGMKPGTMVGTSWTDYVHPDDQGGLSPIATGDTRTNLVRARRGDGSYVWIESTTTNLTLDPAVRGYVSNFRDVSKRVEAEQAVQDARARLEYLLSATSAVTYSAKPSGDFGATFVSANVRDVLGWEPSRFLDESAFWISHVHPEDRSAIDAGLPVLFETGQLTTEYRFQHGDGSYRWLHDEARLVRSYKGEPTEVIGFMVDVTERKRAEESLRRSEANFRVLAERSPTVILVHRGGKLLYMNPAGVAMLGYERADDMIGMPVLDLVHPDDHAAVTTRMAHTERHGGGAPGEARMRRRDGTYVVTEGEGIVLDFDGAPATVVVGRDITERRELFARMALADRLLSVGTLAAGVAHEINNPLAYVSSNLELLVRELPALLAGEQSQLARHEVAELLSDAREGAARVGSIVRDLRALSRNEDEAGPVDLAGVLASCIKIAHNEIRHRARVMSHIDADLPSATGTASRLGQVFLNLLVNAAQAIPAGKVDANEIRVRAYADRDAGQVVVEISDTGVGIPRPLLGRIFDPFFTTKPVGLGTGLGLSICHEIVRSLGGAITVASTLGTGSTFKVVLPITDAIADENVATESRRATGAARVLVIDDEQAVGRSIALLLSPEYDVTCVTRAKDALERLTAGERYDAIVCDVMMPEMTGIDFFEKLSAVAPDARQRTLFLTGGAFTAQAHEFLLAATRPHLEKPFSERDLRRAIEAVRSAP